MAWLPLDPDKDLSGSWGLTGLDGYECWKTVFSDRLLNELVHRALGTPVHIIMLGPKRSPKR